MFNKYISPSFLSFTLFNKLGQCLLFYNIRLFIGFMFYPHLAYWTHLVHFIYKQIYKSIMRSANNFMNEINKLCNIPLQNHLLRHSTGQEVWSMVKFRYLIFLDAEDFYSSFKAGKIWCSFNILISRYPAFILLLGQYFRDQSIFLESGQYFGIPLYTFVHNIILIQRCQFIRIIVNLTHSKSTIPYWSNFQLM